MMTLFRLRRFAAAGSLVGLMFLAACGNPASAGLSTNAISSEADLTANTMGALTARVNTKACLDVVNASTKSGAPVQMWTCHNAKNQLWKVKEAQVSVYDSLCLAASGTDNGSKVIVVTCDVNDTAQAWKAKGDQLIHVASNKCLDVRDGGHANGTRLQLWDCFDGNINQTWLMPNEKPTADSVGPSDPGTATPNPTPVTSTGAANVDAAVTQSVNFADWGISGGFTAMPLKDLLALHPQMAGYQQEMVNAAASVNPPIPPQLLVAICLQESSGGLNVGHKGGPFQFTDDNAWNAYGPPGGDRNSMADGAKGAAGYLEFLLNMYNGDLNAALRYYNGPIANGGKPEYQSEIQQWMQGVLVYGTGV